MSSGPSMALLVAYSEKLGCNTIIINNACDPDRVIELAREVGAVRHDGSGQPEFVVDFAYLGNEPKPDYFGEETLRTCLENDLAAAKTIGV